MNKSVQYPNLEKTENQEESLVEALNEAELDLLHRELMEDIIDTPYTSKRMIIIAQKYELDKKETFEISRIIKEYRIKPQSIEKILEAGVQPLEVESFVHLYKESNDGSLEFISKQVEPFNNNKEEEIRYYVTNLSQYMSYDNLLFVQKFINGDASQVKDALYGLNLLDDEEDGPGLGVLLNRMRGLYAIDKKYKACSLESLAYISLNKIKTSHNSEE